MDNDEQRDYAEEAANAALLADPDPEPGSDVPLSPVAVQRFRQLALGMHYGASIGGRWRHVDARTALTVADVLDYLDRLGGVLHALAEQDHERDAELAAHRQFAGEVRRVHGVLSGEYTVQSVYGVQS